MSNYCVFVRAGDLCVHLHTCVYLRMCVSGWLEITFPERIPHLSTAKMILGVFVVLHLQKSKCFRKIPVTQSAWYRQMILIRATGPKCVFSSGWDPVRRHVWTRAVLWFQPKFGDNPTIYPLLLLEQHPVFTFKKKRTFRRQLWGPDNQRTPRRQVRRGAASSPGSKKASPHWRQPRRCRRVGRDGEGTALCTRPNTWHHKENGREAPTREQTQPAARVPGDPRICSSKRVCQRLHQ